MVHTQKFGVTLLVKDLGSKGVSRFSFKTTTTMMKADVDVGTDDMLMNYTHADDRGIHLCERRAVVGERKIGYSVVIFLEKEPLKPWKSGRLGSKFSLKLTKKTPKPWNIPSKIVK